MLQTIKKNISVIPAVPAHAAEGSQQTKLLRVAAYCHVSTLQEQQESSYESQVNHYREKIQNHPGWKLAGIYADDGKSATSTKKRLDFQAMIEDCMAGKIDMVLTKSISRFARNTVDALTNIRKLKEKNIPVIFEKESINTMEGSGELLLTILSSQAQEESRNISENCHWGIVRKFEEGKVMVNHSRFLGYTKDKDGNLVIVPEEAQLVRRIYKLYLEGNSSYRIKRILEAEGIPTVTGKKTWSATTIDRMLSNEKYMGDALLQKTYTVDFLTKKKVKNNGIVPQYYIENDHEAIIPKELFYRVQEEKARRAAIYKPAVKRKNGLQKGKYSGKYVLSDLLYCGECGQPYRRQVWSKYGVKQAVWRCDNRQKNGKKRCKYSPTLKEKTLHTAIMTAINSVAEDQGMFVQAFRENVLQVIGSYEASEKEKEILKQMEACQKKLTELMETGMKDGQGDFEQQYDKIMRKMKELQKARAKTAKENRLAESCQQRTEDLEQYMGKTVWLQREFDEELVRRLIRVIKVVNENKLEIQFHSGIVLVQRMDFEE